MNVITITSQTFHMFESILTDEATARLAPGPDKKEDTYARGILDGDGFPMGAIAIQCSPPTAEVISLYVLEDFRRLGIGSQLMMEAITDAMILPDIEELVVPYVETSEESGLTAFFQSLELDIMDLGVEYKANVKDAVNSSAFSQKTRHKVAVEPWGKLSSVKQKKLFEEGAGLYDYYVKDKLRKDLTFVVMDENQRDYRGCIALAEENGELILAWLRVKNDPIIMMELMNHVLQQLIDNGEQDKVIRIPTINSASEDIVKNVFGDSLTVEYDSKCAVFDFS